MLCFLLPRCAYCLHNSTRDTYTYIFIYIQNTSTQWPYTRNHMPSSYKSHTHISARSLPRIHLLCIPFIHKHTQQYLCIVKASIYSSFENVALSLSVAHPNTLSCQPRSPFQFILYTYRSLVFVFIVLDALKHTHKLTQVFYAFIIRHYTYTHNMPGRISQYPNAMSAQRITVQYRYMFLIIYRIKRHTTQLYST